jgi:hypothetical protein
MSDFSKHLGPTNPCMITNRKETFSTTVFKALLTTQTPAYMVNEYL